MKLLRPEGTTHLRRRTPAGRPEKASVARAEAREAVLRRSQLQRDAPDHCRELSDRLVSSREASGDGVGAVGKDRRRAARRGTPRASSKAASRPRQTVESVFRLGPGPGKREERDGGLVLEVAREERSSLQSSLPPQRGRATLGLRLIPQHVMARAFCQEPRTLVAKQEPTLRTPAGSRCERPVHSHLGGLWRLRRAFSESFKAFGRWLTTRVKLWPNRPSARLRVLLPLARVSAAASRTSRSRCPCMHAVADPTFRARQGGWRTGYTAFVSTCEVVAQQ